MKIFLIDYIDLRLIDGEKLGVFLRGVKERGGGEFDFLSLLLAFAVDFFVRELIWVFG